MGAKATFPLSLLLCSWLHPLASACCWSPWWWSSRPVSPSPLSAGLCICWFDLASPLGHAEVLFKSLSCPKAWSPLPFNLITERSLVPHLYKRLGLYLPPFSPISRDFNVSNKKTPHLPHWNQDVLLHFLSPTAHVLTLRRKQVTHTPIAFLPAFLSKLF